MLIGLSLAVLGTLALTLSASSPSIAMVAICCFVIGFGFGWVAAPSLIAAQSSVSWSDRGVVTGTNLFARSIGSAVGVAVFGAIANAILAAAPGGEHDPAAIVAASGAVFTAVAVGAVLTVAAGLLMPRSRVEDVELVATRE